MADPCPPFAFVHSRSCDVWGTRRESNSFVTHANSYIDSDSSSKRDAHITSNADEYTDRDSLS